MDNFELPEMVTNTVKTVCSNMEFTWNLYHSENRVSVTLIWTKPRINKKSKNGDRHFRNQTVRNQPQNHPTETSGSSACPVGFASSSHPDNPALEHHIIMPQNQLDKPPEKKRRRKTPSHYRRDQRRLREYKSKRSRGLSPDDNSHPVEKTVHSSVQDTCVQDSAPVPATVLAPPLLAPPLIAPPALAPPLLQPKVVNNIPTVQASLHLFDPLYTPPTFENPTCGRVIDDPGGGGSTPSLL